MGGGGGGGGEKKCVCVGGGGGCLSFWECTGDDPVEGHTVEDRNKAAPTTLLYRTRNPGCP